MSLSFLLLSLADFLYPPISIVVNIKEISFMLFGIACKIWLIIVVIVVKKYWTAKHNGWFIKRETQK